MARNDGVPEYSALPREYLSELTFSNLYLGILYRSLSQKPRRLHNIDGRCVIPFPPRDLENSSFRDPNVQRELRSRDTDFSLERTGSRSDPRIGSCPCPDLHSRRGSRIEIYVHVVIKICRPARDTSRSSEIAVFLCLFVPLILRAIDAAPA